MQGGVEQGSAAPPPLPAGPSGGPHSRSSAGVRPAAHSASPPGPPPARSAGLQKQPLPWQPRRHAPPPLRLPSTWPPRSGPPGRWPQPAGSPHGAAPPALRLPWLGLPVSRRAAPPRPGPPAAQQPRHSGQLPRLSVQRGGQPPPRGRQQLPGPWRCRLDTRPPGRIPPASAPSGHAPRSAPRSGPRSGDGWIPAPPASLPRCRQCCQTAPCRVEEQTCLLPGMPGAPGRHGWHWAAASRRGRRPQSALTLTPPTSRRPLTGKAPGRAGSPSRGSPSSSPSKTPWDSRGKLRTDGPTRSNKVSNTKLHCTRSPRGK